MGVKLVLTHKQELQREIALLENRQAQRREYVKQVEAMIAMRQLTIDNLRAQLEAQELETNDE